MVVRQRDTLWVGNTFGSIDQKYWPDRDCVGFTSHPQVQHRAWHIVSTVLLDWMWVRILSMGTGKEWPWTICGWKAGLERGSLAGEKVYSFQEKEAETMLLCDLSERMLEVCKELGWIKNLRKNTFSSSGTLLAWDKGFPSLSLQASETEAHSSYWETGNSVAASFIGLEQNSVIALSLQKLTLASQWPISCHQQWPPSLSTGPCPPTSPPPPGPNLPPEPHQQSLFLHPEWMGRNF